MKVILPIEGSFSRYPKGNLIQGYGENPALYQSAIDMKYHNGWDLVKGYGAKVMAPTDGTIVAVQMQGQGYGNHIYMISEPENGRYLYSVLGHLTENVFVKAGDKVKLGQQVGEMGNSGFVVSNGVAHWGGSNPDKKGTHLHWTTKWLRPISGNPPGPQYYNLLNQVYQIENYNNGVAGAFDPMTLFKEQDMEFFQIDGESTIVAKVFGKYFKFATDPVFYPYLKDHFQFPQSFPQVSRSEVDGNLGGTLEVGITFKFI